MSRTNVRERNRRPGLIVGVKADPGGSKLVNDYRVGFWARAGEVSTLATSRFRTK